MGSKPSVLLADDHAEMLKGVTGLLRSRFDIVATVSNGRMALDAASAFHPDLAVLDIAMPELDGIRTAKELKRRGLRSRVVFLTLHHDDGYVSAAIDSGALGYVVKSRLHLDLVQALGLALAGYRFVSPHAFTSGPELRNGDSAVRWFGQGEAKHSMQFHPDDDFLLASWTDFLGAALSKGAVAVIFATQVHEAELARRLKALGLDVPAAIELGQYIPLDVDRVLSSVMVAGWPDESRLGQTFESLANEASTRNGHRQIAMAGEIAPLLWAAGKPEAAIGIEHLANNWIRAQSSCSILCSYPVGCFHRKHDRELLVRTCAEHTAVVPA